MGGPARRSCPLTELELTPPHHPGPIPTTVLFVPERLVVIGGDAAGMSAASQARRRRGSDDLSIVAFERGVYTSYSACGIPYWIGNDVDSMDDLVTRTPEEFGSKQDTYMRIRSEVESLDLDRRSVRVRDLDGGRTYDEPFDQLVLATGSVPMRPPIDGMDADGVYGVQTLDDGEALRAELDSGDVRDVVVVGGGYIGLEIPEAAKSRGFGVTVVDLSETPIGTFDPDVGHYLADAVRDLGIDLILGDGATRIETDREGRVCAVHTKSGRALPADLVVLGLGVRPNVALAKA